MNDTVTPHVNAAKEFGPNAITVTLEWTHINGVSCIIDVDPMVAVNYTGRNTAKLVMMYDNKYNVSVIASLCGTNRTTMITINQGKLIEKLLWYKCDACL